MPPSRARKNSTPRKRLRPVLERLLTSPLSPLAFTNLRSLLSKPEAWNVLSNEDRSEILALLPDTRHVNSDTDPACLNLASLMSDESFKSDCGAYTANLAAGRHELCWLNEAWEVHKLRLSGKFEGLLNAKFEMEYQVELPAELKQQPAEPKQQSA